MKRTTRVAKHTLELHTDSAGVQPVLDGMALTNVSRLEIVVEPRSLPKVVLHLVPTHLDVDVECEAITVVKTDDGTV